MGGEGLPIPFNLRALESHVAVRDSPYPVAHPHCLAGDDGRHRERRRRDQDPARLRRVLRTGWLGASGGRRRMGLSFYGAGVALVLCFTMELVASTPRLPPWVRAQLLEFTGSTFSDPMGDVPGPLYGWHDTESSQARSERAETGLIGQSPIASIDTFGFHRHGRG